MAIENLLAITPFPALSVVALNVTRLRPDNVDPRVYMGRLSDWERQVTESGGSWRVVNDLDHLEALFLM